MESPITVIKGVGDAVAQKFALVGVETIADLIDYYPRRYEDYSVIMPTSQLRPGTVTIEAVIKQATGRYVRRGLHITEAVASDNNGSVRLIWFNQPYRAAALKPGQKYFISGQYELRHQRFSIMNPSIELTSELPVNAARILAVYKETKGLTSRQIRSAIGQIRNIITRQLETLPAWLIAEHDLMSRGEALLAIHAPISSEQLDAARRRLGFEEVFSLSLASQLNRQENQSETAVAIPFDQSLAQEFVKHLPFNLTDAQRRTIWQVYIDMQRQQPMNRLVEGDVGSGKTVVATMAALMVLANNRQVAFMAPTELLARQHAETIYGLLKPLGREHTALLLVGSMTAAKKTQARQAIKNGQAGFLIGTHALIQEHVDMHNLALVVIDEQHRFGVEQRKKLMAKAGHMPHVLSLSATPIPRSLALTLFGELDISVLDQKPAGRQIVSTELVAPGDRAGLYAKLDAELSAGRQMFVVCPLITDSTVVDAQSAEKVYEELRKKHFKHRKIGLLHGKLPSSEKQSTMEKFIRHEIDILVATTVVEVGVDIPNASIMLIESPERFGLAQLHQLRGRVGRSNDQGYCYLLLSDSQAPNQRLRALESSHDGFRLAELDLRLRGPGAIYGLSQHGQLDLRLAQLDDLQLTKSAHKSATLFIKKGENLLQYNQLARVVAKLRAVTNLN